MFYSTFPTYMFLDKGYHRFKARIVRYMLLYTRT